MCTLHSQSRSNWGDVTNNTTTLPGLTNKLGNLEDACPLAKSTLVHKATLARH